MADFFSKTVREVNLAEVEALYAERVPENIRLEYKAKLPDDPADFKETVAKELSAFANSYGGYLIVGISTDAKGNPTAMDGVLETNSLAQRIVSVGYEQIFPPVIPVVSNPIKLPNGNFVHVIYQDLSLEAPHFLNRRRGAYIRTSEFSQTFTPKLASWDELQLLQNRRSMAIQQRGALRERGRRRSEIFVPPIAGTAKLHMAISPAFPFRRLIEPNEIERAIQEASFSVSRGASRVPYPRGDKIVAHESQVITRSNFYVEATAWGSSYFVEFFEQGSRGTAAIRFEHVLAALVQHMKFGSKLLRACGHNGLINIEAKLFDSFNKNFRWEDYGQIDVHCREPGEINYELEKPLNILMNDYLPALLEIFRSFAFALGWEGVFAQKDADFKAALQQDREFFYDLQ
jgi:hypothetical protein